MVRVRDDLQDTICFVLFCVLRLPGDFPHIKNRKQTETSFCAASGFHPYGFKVFGAILAVYEKFCHQERDLKTEIQEIISCHVFQITDMRQ